MSEESRRKALNTAAAVLQYKNRSRQELYQRLLEKDVAEEDAAYAVERLVELGLMDDGAYAQSLAHNYAARGYGPARVRQELKKHLLEEEDISAALEDFSPDYDKMNAYIRSRLGGKTPDRREIKKITDGLFRRGFSWGDIRHAMQEYTDALEDCCDD